MKKIYFALLLMFLSDGLQSQIINTEQHRLKYWYYRERLRNDFMLGIGPNFGESIPASIRFEDSFDGYINNNGYLKWGDATIDLSYYIAVLAMEFKLLWDNNESTYETLRELYYAIEAFNRLDYHAITYDYFNGPNCCTGGPTPSLDGFFVRNDVGRGLFDGDINSPNQQFYNYLTHLNGNNSNHTLINSLISEWINYFSDNSKNMFFESKDQLVYINVAMSFVVKCVPWWIDFIESGSTSPKQFMDGETSLHREAQNIINRTIDYIHDPGDGSGPNDWSIRTPYTQVNVTPGAGCWPLAYGFSRTCKKLTDHNNPNTWRQYTDPSWWSAIATFVGAYQFYDIVFGIGGDQLKGQGKMLLNLTTASGCCGITTVGILNRAFVWSKHKTLQMPGQFAALHNKTDAAFSLSPQYYENYFDVAPCEGPHNLGSQLGGYAEYEWSSTSRSVHPQRRGQDPPDFPGQYNGLDYMFLFNLHELNKYGNNPEYFKRFSAHISKDFPFNFNSSPFIPPIIGTDYRPFYAHTFDYLSADNKIAANGNAYYRSKEIDLLPGFQAVPGAEFTAVADDIECQSNLITLYRFNNNSADTVKNELKKQLYQQNKSLFVTAFPIPSSDKLNLRISTLVSGNAVLKIYDMEGKVLHKEQFIIDSFNEYFAVIQLHQFPAGIYQATIQCNKEIIKFKINVIK